MTPHHSHDPRQLELFPPEILRPCLEHELGRLERTWKADDFNHGWKTAAVEAHLAGRP